MLQLFTGSKCSPLRLVKCFVARCNWSVLWLVTCGTQTPLENSQRRPIRRQRRAKNNHDNDHRMMKRSTMNREEALGPGPQCGHTRGGSLAPPGSQLGRLPDNSLAQCFGADLRWMALDRDHWRAVFPAWSTWCVEVCAASMQCRRAGLDKGARTVRRRRR